jgi:hypothetical protein
MRSGAPEHALGAPPTRAAPRRARAYKSHPGLDRTLPRTTDPTQARVRRSSPVSKVLAAAQATATIDRPP